MSSRSRGSGSNSAQTTTANIIVKPLQVAGGIMNTVLAALLQIVGGFTQGVDMLGAEAEKFIESFINSNVNVRLMQVFESIGNQCKYVAGELGRIIAAIPLVGDSVAYVVRGTGDNVYHIVMSTGRFISSTVKKSATFVNKSLDLCVFTITAVSSEVEAIGKDVVYLIDNLSLRKRNSGSIKDVVGGGRRNSRASRVRRRTTIVRGGASRRTRSRARSSGGGPITCYTALL